MLDLIKNFLRRIKLIKCCKGEIVLEQVKKTDDLFDIQSKGL